MAIKEITRVWERSSASGSHLLLMLALADRADEDGICWPGNEYLAQRARVQDRHLKRMKRALEASGELFTIQYAGRTHSNSYLVSCGRPAEELAEILTRRFRIPKEGAAEIADYLVRRQNGDRESQPPMSFLIFQKGDSQDTFIHRKRGLGVRKKVACRPPDPSLDPSVNNDPSIKKEGAAPSAPPPPVDLNGQEITREHPALRTYKALTGLYPAREQFKLVADIILQHGFTAETLAPFWKQWFVVEHNKPTNLAWLVEWAVAGELPGRRVGKGKKKVKAGETNFRRYDQGEFAQYFANGDDPDPDDGEAAE